MKLRRSSNQVAPAAAALIATALLATGCSPASPAVAPSIAAQQARVSAVIDGDTLKVRTGSGEVRVRIIGIDTPEIHRDGTPSDCYAEQARDMLDDLAYGRTVELRADTTQADTDKYGRLLRHVYVDGVNVALTEIQAGAGPEYTYDAPYAGQDEYRAAQRDAQQQRRGLWGEC